MKFKVQSSKFKVFNPESFRGKSSKFKVLAILAILSILSNLFAAGVSTNKTFMVGTNNALPPDETNFFQVNSNLLGQFAAPSIGWITEQLSTPGIYVDSVFGNDSNSGGQGQPLQHLYAVTAILGHNSTVATNIYLKRGSKFYESFVVPTNAFLGDYGGGGVKPIISGVTNLANGLFSLTAGKTNTYQMPLFVPIETNVYPSATLVQSNVLMVWQSNQRMGARWDQNASYNNNTNTAINSVDGNPSSFFYDVTNHVLYINPSTNGNPATNGLIYEASIRTLALVGSSNCTVSNIIAEKAYAHDTFGNQGYSILGQFSGTFINCVGRGGWNHIMGSAPSLAYVGTNTWINCYGYDVESNITYNVAGTVFVADSGSATNWATMPACGIFSNCLAVATPGGLASAVSTEFTSGFYMHEITNLNVMIYNCVASNCYYGFVSQSNITVLTNCVAASCYDGVEAIDPTGDVVDHFYAYNCTNGAVGQFSTTNLTVNNSQFWQMNNAGIWGRVTTNLYATNNIFAGTNHLSYGILANPGTDPIWSWSNSFFGIYGAYVGGMFTNLSGANTSDYNNYYNDTRIAGNQIPSPGYALTFSAWQSLWPLADVHGTTSNPAYPNSDFAYGLVTPSGPDINFEEGSIFTNLQAANISGTLPAASLPEWVIARLSPPGIYVDSVLGSDTNSGVSQNSPLQHLYAVTAALGTSISPTNIYLNRGSKFYESFVVPPNALLCDYGVGVKPIISGVTNLANKLFSLTAATTNTYQMPLIVPMETNSFSGTTIVQSNVLMVWQSNQRMGARWDQNASYNSNTNTAIASVDGNPNSFFYDLTNHVLYINPSTNGSPVTNGLLYEASIRTLALVGTSNCVVSNIIAEKSYACNNDGNQGYAMLGQFSGTFIDCVGRHGWNAIMGAAPPLAYAGTNAWINCYAYDVESNISYFSAGVCFIAEAASATNLATMPACGIFSNCLAVATPGGLASSVSTEFTSGFYAPEQTNLNVQIYNCVASNCYYGFISQTNITVLTNCTAVNCYDGTEAIDPTGDKVDHFYAYNCTNGVVGQFSTTNLTVNNSQFWQMNNAGIWGRVATNLYATNNIFAATNGLSYGILANPGTTPVWSWSNSFAGLDSAYIGGMFTNLSGANTADYNNYYGLTKLAQSMIPSPGYATAFANWQTMWPLADVHGTTANPAYPTSDFAYAVISPSGPDSNSVVVQASNLVGTIPSSSLPAAVLTNFNAGVANLASNLNVQQTNFSSYGYVTNNETVNGILKLGADCQMSDHSGTMAFYDPTSTTFFFGASSLGAGDGNVYAATFNGTPIGSGADLTANTMPLNVLVDVGPNTVLGNPTGTGAAVTATGNLNVTNLTTTANGGITTSNVTAIGTISAPTNLVNGFSQATNATSPGTQANVWANGPIFNLNGTNFTAVQQVGNLYVTGLTNGITQWKGSNYFQYETNFTILGGVTSYLFGITNFPTWALGLTVKAEVLTGICATNQGTYLLYSPTTWIGSLSSGSLTYITSAGNSATALASIGRTSSGSVFAITTTGPSGTTTNMTFHAIFNVYYQ